MITKPEGHDIDSAGERLLREAMESLGWVVNAVEKDYGLDFNVQVFDGKSPTGTWFHVQLKSSASSDYSADRSFISQEITVDHARHYALELREPVLVIHADVESRRVYWYAPQLDRQLRTILAQTKAQSTTFRVPTRQLLPDTAPALLSAVENIHLALATRDLTSASAQSFAENLRHLPDQERLHRAFQEKSDTLKLHKIGELYKDGKYDEAKPRAEGIIDDLDSTVEVQFWAQLQLEGIDFSQTVQAGKPQNELAKATLKHAKTLQKLTASGPKYLKLYSLIARKAAELEVLVHENFSLFMALKQHFTTSAIRCWRWGYTQGVRRSRSASYRNTTNAFDWLATPPLILTAGCLGGQSKESSRRLHHTLRRLAQRAMRNQQRHSRAQRFKFAKCPLGCVTKPAMATVLFWPFSTH